MLRIALILTAILSVTFSGFSQGCSDAGFCTMGAMRPDQSYSKKFNIKPKSLELNYYKGKTTLSPVVRVITADMTYTINDKMAFQIKVPYQMVKGNLGKNKGMGDISLSASRNMGTVGDYDLNLTVGAKIPTGDASDKGENEEFEGVVGRVPEQLPMYYQVSLGTYDFVAGASLINDKWLFATGIQVPVIHQNKNDFRWGKWTDYPDQDYIQEYFLANDLERGIDVMLRAERNFRFLNYNFSLGLLPIYRITRDERYDFNIDERIKVDGSTGLALSALASAGYQFNVSNAVKLIYGHKLMERNNNPDGLTRHSVLSFSYIYKF
ncbi:hypothetical protein [Marinoscillum sp. MHG1-6]|uniref:hypothetical protein n=1 Tax=Marinoscillum sp. MHG1-6 TaxID=2959627 RepID=UPI002157DD06|nr:hypothetical protein [Marinoscillum sp. MHG1-6]